MDATRYDTEGKPALRAFDTLGLTSEGLEILRDRGNTEMFAFDPVTQAMRSWPMYAVYGAGPIDDDWGTIMRRLGWYQIGQTALGQPVYDLSESPYGSAYPRQGEHPWSQIVEDQNWVNPYRPAPPPPAPLLIRWFRRLFL